MGIQWRIRYFLSGVMFCLAVQALSVVHSMVARTITVLAVALMVYSTYMVHKHWHLLLDVYEYVQSHVLLYRRGAGQFGKLLQEYLLPFIKELVNNPRNAFKKICKVAMPALRDTVLRISDSIAQSQTTQTTKRIAEDIAESTRSEMVMETIGNVSTTISQWWFTK